ncbi:PAS domain S-box protein [Zoogloea sp. LCSB751]|uniref:PAS domain S-box protein n=1 Tax=Zoogloea sp. LCSB751 TaxID=1965277 RepID=UPI0009A53315|nr:PAS domain S-box protein [Zoogloea sp. LCSB751]
MRQTASLQASLFGPQDSVDERRLSRIVRILAASIVVLGIGVLLGWAVDIPIVRTLGPGLASMKANTAAGFVLAGLALFCSTDRRPALQRCARSLGLAAGLLGLAQSIQEMFNLDLGLDNLIVDFHRAVGEATGRMAAASAACLTLGGVALTAGHSPWGDRLCRYATALMGFLGLMAIFGYLFDVEAFYHLAPYSNMSGHTALGFTLLALGIVVNRLPPGGFGWLTRIAVATAVAALLVVGGIVAERLRSVDEADRLENHTWQVMLEVQQMLASLLDAESAERGYAGIGDEHFLSAYRHSVAELRARLVEVRRLSVDNPAQQQRLQELEIPLKAKLAGMDLTIALRQKVGADAAQASLRDFWREGHMNDIRQGVADILAEEARLLQLRQRAKEQAAEHALQTLMRGGIFGILTLLGIFFLLWRENARRQASEAALREHRKHLEELVVERDNALTLAIAGADLGTWSLEIGTNMVVASVRCLELFGFEPRNSVPLEDFVRRIHPDDRTIMQGALAEAISNGSVYRCEYRVVWPDASIHWLAASGHASREEIGREPMHISGVVLDITERRQHEEALRESEARFRSFFENMAVGAGQLDARGRYLDVNERYCQITGYSRKALLDGMGPLDITHPDDIPADRERVRRLLTDGDIYDAEKRFVRKDGEIAWVHITASVVRDADGAVRYVTGAIEDITARKAAEAALKESRQRLINYNQDLAREVEARTAELSERQRELLAAKDAAEQASAAKSAFLATMSHEIRTPLNAILGTVQILERGPLDEDQRQLVRTLRTAGRGLLGQINDVLDLSKIEAGHFELERSPFVLHNVISNLVDVLSPVAAAKGIALEWAPLPEIASTLIGDAQRLSQVLYNLTGNALKFTSKGHVAVSVQALVEEAGSITLRFSIRDTGIGLAPEQLERVFDAFVQADESTQRRYGGTGLGLAICRRLVTLMGGEIGVESRLGEGSEFWFTVPFEVDNSTTQDLPSDLAACEGPRLAGLRVLVVDDSPVNLDIARRLLELEGARCEIVDSGHTAIEKLTAAPCDFDLVLMDVQMPELNGIDATRAIRGEATLANLPIVALTAGALPSQRERAMQAGMNDFLAKPFEIDTLVATARRWAGQAIRAGTAPASRSPVEDAAVFPQIDGVDTAAASRRLLGDRALFLSALARLRDEFANVVDEVRTALARQDLETARQRMHKLRGGAGNLSAVEVAELAARLEATYEGGNVGAGDTDLGTLETAVKRLFASAAPWLTQPPVTAACTDVQSITNESLFHLIAALQANDFAALGEFEAQQAALEARFGATAIEPIVVAVENLRFTPALDLLQSLAERH